MMGLIKKNTFLTLVFLLTALLAATFFLNEMIGQGMVCMTIFLFSGLGIIVLQLTEINLRIKNIASQNTGDAPKFGDVGFKGSWTPSPAFDALVNSGHEPDPMNPAFK